jgi:hypothetical protein
VSTLMKMADGNPDNDQAEYRRLLNELDRLEQEQRQVDLRDERAVDACQRRLEALRKQIAALCSRAAEPPRNARADGVPRDRR